MKDGQKLKLGDAHVTPRNIQEVQASKLGDAQGIPLLHQQNHQVISLCYVFIVPCIMCYSWSVFILVFFIFCFVCCSIHWILLSFVWERDTLQFIAQNTLVSLHYSSSVYSLLVLRLALVLYLYFELSQIILWIIYVCLAL